MVHVGTANLCVCVCVSTSSKLRNAMLDLFGMFVKHILIFINMYHIVQHYMPTLIILNPSAFLIRVVDFESEP